MADSFLVRQSRVFLGDRLTPMGRMVFYLTIPGIGLGTTSLGIKVYVVGLALLCLLGCSVVAARLSRVPLAVRLFLPPRATRGQPFQIQATLRNQTQRKARDLQLRLEDLPLHFKGAAQPPVRLPGRFDLGDLDPGRETKWNWEIVSQKRGPCTVRTVRLATLFPFNLWSDWYDCPVASSILIYPSFTALETLDIPVG